MTTEDLCYLSASEALRLFRARVISPVELLEALIERSARVEPVVNAFSDTYFERALQQARAAEAAYARGGSPRPLEGIPVAAKTNTDCAVEGTTSTNGCAWLTNDVDGFTAPSMERLLQAGAILQARTTMPELGWAWTCYTKAHGTTRNPWNPAFSSGGSSSGSAAAVAAGTATIATATDCLGSLRHPSAMCGVLGFKPPYGRNPLHPWMSFDFFKHTGPITRCVADTALMQNITSGQHPLDHNTVTQRVVLPAQPRDVAGMRIAFSLNLGYFPVAEDVARETYAALEALRSAGAEAVEVEVTWAEPVMKAASRYVDRTYGDMFIAAVRDHPDEVCNYTAYYAREAESVTPEETRSTLEAAGWAWRDHFGPLFQRFDAFMTPTLTCHDVPADNPPWAQNIVIGGSAYTDHDVVMTGLFNLYSRCPVLAVPSGFTDSGMPTSLQVAGRPFDDATPFRVAACLERERPWLDSTERRPRVTEVVSTA